MKWTVLLIAAYAVLTGASAHAQYSLTFLHNNDGESQLLGTGPNDAFGGIARFATMLDQTRTFYESQGHGVVAVSSGDYVSGRSRVPS